MQSWIFVDKMLLVWKRACRPQSHVYEQRKITTCKVSWQLLLVIVYNASLVDANTAGKHTIQTHYYKDDCLNYDTAFSIAFDKLIPKRSHPFKCLPMQVYASLCWVWIWIQHNTLIDITWYQNGKEVVHSSSQISLTIFISPCYGLFIYI